MTERASSAAAGARTRDEDSRRDRRWKGAATRRRSTARRGRREGDAAEERRSAHPHDSGPWRARGGVAQELDMTTTRFIRAPAGRRRRRSFVRLGPHPSRHTRRASRATGRPVERHVATPRRARPRWRRAPPTRSPCRHASRVPVPRAFTSRVPTLPTLTPRPSLARAGVPATARRVPPPFPTRYSCRRCVLHPVSPSRRQHLAPTPSPSLPDAPPPPNPNPDPPPPFPADPAARPRVHGGQAQHRAQHSRRPARLAELGVEIHRTRRGGDVTYHGPGQTVLYPVVHLRESRLGARAYVEGLEDVMIAAAASFGVRAFGRVPADDGGVGGRQKDGRGGRARGGVSTHGAAFNRDPDLRMFDDIVPCGLEGRAVTSLALELRERDEGDGGEKHTRAVRGWRRGSWRRSRRRLVRRRRVDARARRRPGEF